MYELITQEKRFRDLQVKKIVEDRKRRKQEAEIAAKEASKTVVEKETAAKSDIFSEMSKKFDDELESMVSKMKSNRHAALKQKKDAADQKVRRKKRLEDDRERERQRREERERVLEMQLEERTRILEAAMLELDPLHTLDTDTKSSKRDKKEKSSSVSRSLSRAEMRKLISVPSFIRSSKMLGLDHSSNGPLDRLPEDEQIGLQAKTDWRSVKAVHLADILKTRKNAPTEAMYVDLFKKSVSGKPITPALLKSLGKYPVAANIGNPRARFKARSTDILPAVA